MAPQTDGTSTRIVYSDEPRSFVYTGFVAFARLCFPLSFSLDATTASLYYLSALIMRLNLLFIRVQRSCAGYLLVEGISIKVLLQKKKQIKSESGAIIGSL